MRMSTLFYTYGHGIRTSLVVSGTGCLSYELSTLPKQFLCIKFFSRYEIFVSLHLISSVNMEKLTHQEEEVMLIVWQKGEGTIRDYHELSVEPRMPYTTFASVIKNLERKKYIKIRRIGTTNLCVPSIEEREYKRTFISGVIRDYFQNSYKEMVSFFAKEEKISVDELKEIIKIIEKNS